MKPAKSEMGLAQRPNLPLLLGVVIGALLLGWLTVRTGVVAITRLSAPTLALALNPGDARAQARFAELTVGNGAGASANAARLAKTAIAREPSLPSALRTLAFHEAANDRPAMALALLNQASRASKGDLGSQVALIEAAVARDDIPTALYHYDIALRGSRDAAPLLFPPLVRASDEPSIMLPLTDYLAKKPAWKDGYLLALVEKGPSPSETASLLLRLKARGLPPGEDIIVPFINRYIAAQDFAQARRLFQAFIDPTGLDRLRDPSFRRTGAPTPFDWTLGSAYGLTVAPGVTEIGPGIAITASPDCCGEVVSQLMMLRSGRHVLSWGEHATDPGSKGRVSWTVICQGANPRRILIAPVAQRAGEGSYHYAFEVPAGCDAQRIALEIRPGDETINLVLGRLAVTTDTAAPTKIMGSGSR